MPDRPKGIRCAPVIFPGVWDQGDVIGLLTEDCAFLDSDHFASLAMAVTGSLPSQRLPYAAGEDHFLLESLELSSFGYYNELEAARLRHYAALACWHLRQQLRRYNSLHTDCRNSALGDRTFWGPSQGQWRLNAGALAPCLDL